jgi:hypothetical protein
MEYTREDCVPASHMFCFSIFGSGVFSGGWLLMLQRCTQGNVVTEDIYLFFSSLIKHTFLILYIKQNIIIF